MMMNERRLRNNDDDKRNSGDDIDNNVDLSVIVFSLPPTLFLSFSLSHT